MVTGSQVTVQHVGGYYMNVVSAGLAASPSGRLEAGHYLVTAVVWRWAVVCMMEGFNQGGRRGQQVRA
jgi:hypothetical protein